MNNHESANLNGMTRYCKEAEEKFEEYLEGLMGYKGKYSENTRGKLMMAIGAMKQIIRDSENRLEQLTQTSEENKFGGKRKMGKVINLEEIKNKEYNALLRMAGELAVGNPEEKRRKFLEDEINSILEENPDYTLMGGGFSGDYNIQTQNSEENK